jgi:hypothetical protein
MNGTIPERHARVQEETTAGGNDGEYEGSQQGTRKLPLEKGRALDVFSDGCLGKSQDQVHRDHSGTEALEHSIE